MELPPAGAAPAVARLPPRTYRELYSEAANNPTPARAAAYLSDYRFTGRSWRWCRAHTSGLARPDGGTQRPPVDGIPGPSRGAGGENEVVIVHRLLRFMDAPGDDLSSGLHDRVLGLMGASSLTNTPPWKFPAPRFTWWQRQ